MEPCPMMTYLCVLWPVAGMGACCQRTEGNDTHWGPVLISFNRPSPRDLGVLLGPFLEDSVADTGTVTRR